MLIVNLLFLSAALLLVAGEFSMGLLGSYGLSVLAVLAAALMIFLIKKPSRPQVVVLLALLANAALVIWLCNLTFTAVAGGNLFALVALAIFIALPFSNGIYALKAPTSPRRPPGVE